MAVLKIFPLLGNSYLRKRNINPVLFHQVPAVLTIFVGVPIVIVFTIPVVIALLTAMVVAVRLYHYRGKQ
jgi:hypothetical protein